MTYVTSLVDGLEARGIVQGRPHATDRRAKVIVLTADGELAREAPLDRIHEPPPCFGALSSAEIRELRDLLAKLVAAADTDASADRHRADSRRCLAGNLPLVA